MQSFVDAVGARSAHVWRLSSPHGEILIGRSVRLHRGTVCRLDDEAHGFRAMLCTITAFDAETGKWVVRLQGKGSDDGELVYASEKALRLVYCLLPTSLSRAKVHCHLAFEDLQGMCGRGLITKQFIKAGSILWEDRPIIVVYHGDTSRHEHSHAQWLAHVELTARAEQEQELHGHAGEWAAALAAFEDLAFYETATGSVRNGATSTCARYARSVFGMKRNSQKSPQQYVADVLMRFRCNAIGGFCNGATSGEPLFGASAVYAFTSRINHSCAPSVTVIAKEKLLGGTDVTADGDVIVACARRDLNPGERLTFCYAAEMSLDWDVQQRQAFLRTNMGFTCGCERCVAEETLETETEAGGETCSDGPSE